MDPHQVLGVRRGATPQQVTQAFRREVRRGGHPDTGGDAHAFRRLVAARDALLTPPPTGPATPAPSAPRPHPRPAPQPRPAGPSARPTRKGSDSSALPLIVLTFVAFITVPHILLALVLVVVP
ncbi:J domain-containing protein [Jiangella sp. DSM 45060]|uniref:J domain-containing protein n=1 Tax=Jiangella sp. DSM 45060 TaxID=1798224 RepID=UPI0012FD4447|nr:J domain-containing protein [Jiangella sp. DSM 45060]